MKKVALAIFLVSTLLSCEDIDFENPFKKDRKEKPCPTVNSESMPLSVTATFNEKYPNSSSVIWFNKDGKAFCASFTFNGNKILAQFSNEGVFIKEESDFDQDGEHQDENDDDENDDDEGCNCDTED